MKAFHFGIILVVLFLTSCSFRYNSLVQPILKAQMAPSDATFLPFKFDTQETTTVRILSKSKPLTVQVPPNQAFLLPLDPVYQNEDPKISFQPRHSIEFNTTGSGKGPFKDGETARHYIQINEMKSEQRGLVTAFYKPERRAQTLRFLKKTARQEEVVRQVTGFSPTPIGIVVLPVQEEEQLLLGLGQYHHSVSLDL